MSGRRQNVEEKIINVVNYSKGFMESWRFHVSSDVIFAYIWIVSVEFRARLYFD